MTIKKSWVEGPKFLHFPSFLKKIAIHLGINIKIECERGWWNETIFYEIDGEQHKIDQFERMVINAIKEHNNT
jgi:hypothetical protein